MGINIAIDGPAGSGKSTLARILAKKLSYLYVDTGAMYRAMALHMIRKGIDPSDTVSIAEECRKVRIEIEYRDGEQIVLLNGENVNDLLRTPEVSDRASGTAAVPEVREALLDLQKDLARHYNVVMDGRDIGTTILPDAQVKIFLVASPEARAKRRFKELQEKKIDCTLEQVLQEINERDERDADREASPLRKAEDAVLLDSSEMTIEEVLSAMEKIIAERLS